MEKETAKSKKETKIVLPVGVTDEMIIAWKDRYGQDKIKLASLPKDDDGTDYLDVIIRVPGRKEMSEFEKWMEKNPDKSKEILINSCLLSNKDEVKANEDLFLGAFDAIAKLLPIRTAIIKNL